MTPTMAEQEYELTRMLAMVERMQVAGFGERQIAAAVRNQSGGERSTFARRFRSLLSVGRA